MNRTRPALALLLAAMLPACASTHDRPVSDTPVRIGPPYQVRGATYVPKADPGFDMLGFASWYGTESGKQTANGERFRADWVTAANRTLPLPSYVEVTSLETGRTILVRVNDRGPFGNDWRIVDLSQGAAKELGILARGSAPVRVRVVEPPEKDRARLREGKAAQLRPEVSGKALSRLRAQLKAGCAGDPKAPSACAALKP